MVRPGWAALLVLVLVSSAEVAAQDWRALERRLASHDDDERSAAVRALAELGGERAAALLVPRLDDPNPYVRDLVIEHLGAIGGGAVFEAQLARVPRKAKAQGVRGYLLLFPEFRESFALDPLLQVATRDRDDDLREAALFALRDVLASAARDPEVRGSFPEADWPAERSRRRAARAAAQAISDATWRTAAERLSKDRAPRVRAAALFALGRLPEPLRRSLFEELAWGEDPTVLCAWLDQWLWVDPARARELADRRLAHPVPRVQVRAARVLARCGDEASVARLVARLGEVADHAFVARAIAQALTARTGMRFGTRADEWARWWSDVAAGYRLPRRPDPPPPVEHRATVTWHGLPVDGRRIAFVLDASGSMRDPLGTADRRTKFERAIDELETTLGRLSDGTFVQVIVFGDQPAPHATGFVALGGGARAELVQWTRRQAVRGKTNLLDALLLALDLEDVEALYVLSDGAPSAGAHVFQERVRRAVRDRNATVCASIHTVQLRRPGLDADEERRFERQQRFMARLAEENDGEAIVVR